MRSIFLAAALVLVSHGVIAQQVDGFPLPPKEWPEPVADRELFTFLPCPRRAGACA